MNCRACGDANGRRWSCCPDKPVFCNVCKDLHDKRVHPTADAFGEPLDDNDTDDDDEDHAWGDDGEDDYP